MHVATLHVLVEVGAVEVQLDELAEERYAVVATDADLKPLFKPSCDGPLVGRREPALSHMSKLEVAAQLFCTGWTIGGDAECFRPGVADQLPLFLFEEST